MSETAVKPARTGNTDRPRAGEMPAGFELADAPRVRAFIHGHPFLVPLLDEARTALDSVFGAQSEATLEVAEDPEADGDLRLALRVYPGLPPGEAVSRLEAFDSSRWLENAVRSQGRLCIHLGFR